MPKQSQKMIEAMERLDSVKQYFSRKKTPSAIYDKKFALVWSNKSGQELFSQCKELRYAAETETGIEADAESERTLRPIPKEITVPVKVGGAKLPFTVTPYYYEEKIAYYFVTCLRPGELITLMQKSSVEETVRRVLNKRYSMASCIIQIADAFDKNMDLYDLAGRHDVMKKQIDRASCIIAEIDNMRLLLNEARGEEKTCCINEIIAGIKDECNAELYKIGRMINLKREGGNSLIAMSAKRFTVVVMNLLQNALLFSPPGSDIDAVLRFSDGVAVFSVKNVISQVPYTEERSGLGHAAVRSAVGNIGGYFKYTEKNGYAVSELFMPLCRSIGNKQTYRLGASQKDMIFGEYRPVKLFLNEVIVRETLKY